jgi:hypothetical protein
MGTFRALKGAYNSIFQRILSQKEWGKECIFQKKILYDPTGRDSFSAAAWAESSALFGPDKVYGSIARNRSLPKLKYVPHCIIGCQEIYLPSYLDIPCG